MKHQRLKLSSRWLVVLLFQRDYLIYEIISKSSSGCSGRTSKEAEEYEKQQQLLSFLVSIHIKESCICCYRQFNEIT